MRFGKSRAGPIGLTLCILIGVAMPTAAADSNLIDRRQILELLYKGDYASLESTLTAIQRAAENGEATEYNVRYAFWAFTNSDSRVETRLKEWIGKQPESFVARYALARHYLHVAGAIAASNFMVEAPQESWDEVNSLYRDAMAQIKQVIELNPKFVWSYRELCDLAKKRGDWRSAGLAIQTGLRSNKDSGTLFECAIELVGSNEEKYKLIDDLRERYSTDPNFRFLDGAKDLIRAKDAVDAGDYDAAIRFARQAVDATEDSEMIRYLAEVYHEAGRFEDAIATLDRLLSLTPNSSHGYYWRGRANEALGNWSKANEDYSAALEFDSMNPTALVERARMLLNIGRNQEAIADIENSFQLGSNYHNAHDLRSYYYLYVEPDLGKAIESFRALTRLQPERTRWIYMLGMVLSETENCEAIEVLDRYADMCESGAHCETEESGFRPLSLIEVMSVEAKLRASPKCST